MLSRPSSEHYHGLRQDRGQHRQAAGAVEPLIKTSFTGFLVQPARAAQRHPLCMHTNIFVERNNLPFHAPALPLAGPAHDVSYQPIGRMTI